MRSSLPLELKARIVALVQEQDEFFRERRVDSSEEWLNFDVEAVSTPRHGRGIAADALVCKELNALANIPLFRVRLSRRRSQSSLLNFCLQPLTPAQIGTESAFFLTRILPRHASFVRILDFVTGALALEATVKRAWAFLPVLPSLNELCFGSGPIVRLFGDMQLGSRGEAGDTLDNDGVDDPLLVEKNLARAVLS